MLHYRHCSLNMLIWKYRAHSFILAWLWNQHLRKSIENVTLSLYRQRIMSDGNINVNHYQPFLLKKNLEWSLRRICWRQMSQWERLCRCVGFRPSVCSLLCLQVRSGRTWEVLWAQLSHPARWKCYSPWYQRPVSSWQCTWRTVLENKKQHPNTNQLVIMQISDWVVENLHCSCCNVPHLIINSLSLTL